MKYPISALILALAACTAPQASAPVGTTPQQAAQTRARPYVEGMESLERFRTSDGCDSQGIPENIAELKELVRSFHSLNFASHEREARDRHTTLAFAFAEEALAKGCLDLADQTYRGLVGFYVGNAYSGIRDRARVGVEDVRAARG